MQHAWTWLQEIWKGGEHCVMTQLPAAVENLLFGQSCHMHRHRLLGKESTLRDAIQNQASKVTQQVPYKLMRNWSNAVLHLIVQNLIPSTKRNERWRQKDKRNMNIYICRASSLLAVFEILSFVSKFWFALHVIFEGCKAMGTDRWRWESDSPDSKWDWGLVVILQLVTFTPRQ